MTAEIIVADNLPGVARAAAGFMATAARQAIQSRGRFVVLLSGGSSVTDCYRRFAQEPGIDWNSVYFFWGDERFVDRDNPYSNYRLAQETIFAAQSAIPKENIFPVPVDAASPEDGARQYERTIRAFFRLRPNHWPAFDLAQNGLGPDGHTASLFPGSTALRVRGRLAVMNHAGLQPWVDRVTLTLPVFNHARCVLFIAHGAQKAALLRRVLDAKAGARNLPAARIGGKGVKVVWIGDRAVMGR